MYPHSPHPLVPIRGLRCPSSSVKSLHPLASAIGSGRSLEVLGSRECGGSSHTGGRRACFRVASPPWVFLGTGHLLPESKQRQFQAVWPAVDVANRWCGLGD